MARISDPTSGYRTWARASDQSGAWNYHAPEAAKASTQESGLRENSTSRLSERAEAGRTPHLSRLYSEEVG
jgi:hypothetical protein